MFSLFPKQPDFFNLFDEIVSIQSEMVELFLRFSGRFEDFQSFAEKAKEIEKRGDKKTHEVINLLNGSFITPFDREDIYNLAHELDDIIDLIENVMHNCQLYGVKQKISSMPEFAGLMQKATKALSEMMVCLRKQKNSTALSEQKILIHDLEDQGDELFAKSISELFAKEQNVVELIKVKDILVNMENVMDHFQKVSDIIEGIVVKSS